MAEAIELTYQLFPGILERNVNLLFALKVRQFIEMINIAHTNGSVTSNTNSKLSNCTQQQFKSSNSIDPDQHLVQSSELNDEQMDLDSSPKQPQPSHNHHKVKSPNVDLNGNSRGPMLLLDYNDSHLQKILQFGRELFQLTMENATESASLNTKMLRVGSQFIVIRVVLTVKISDYR